eukprot:scaffold50_cov420-Prasinococcus_capsulatus_cf.AAC.17
MQCNRKIYTFTRSTWKALPPQGSGPLRKAPARARCPRISSLLELHALSGQAQGIDGRGHICRSGARFLARRPVRTRASGRILCLPGSRVD